MGVGQRGGAKRFPLHCLWHTQPYQAFLSSQTDDTSKVDFSENTSHRSSKRKKLPSATITKMILRNQVIFE
ncbi:hypothetical protein D2Q93_04250 [Alicyclobacillaceae bacterium I2511]|nr:hypothetical protein D2Q93_04250 [Alicyclobacillaceae bacterium I2511]